MSVHPAPSSHTPLAVTSIRHPQQREATSRRNWGGGKRDGFIGCILDALYTNVPPRVQFGFQSLCFLRVTGWNGHQGDVTSARGEAAEMKEEAQEAITETTNVSMTGTQRERVVKEEKREMCFERSEMVSPPVCFDGMDPVHAWAGRIQSSWFSYSSSRKGEDARRRGDRSKRVACLRCVPLTFRCNGAELVSVSVLVLSPSSFWQFNALPPPCGQRASHPACSCSSVSS
jgi:hypothetical protein